VTQTVGRARAQANGSAKHAVKRLAARLRAIYPSKYSNDPGFWPLSQQLTPHVLMLYSEFYSSGWLSSWVKRISDLAICTVLIFLALPVMLLIALVIRIDSSGPVFYRQHRVGLRGKMFWLLKFRTMFATQDSRFPAWTVRDDPRITRIGRVIRPMLLDDLPQLINVLRGDMSMVGPRPERPNFTEQLSRVIPFYQDRSYVKPGLTGWAQINYPYGASVEDARRKLAYDLYYVANRSFLLDLRILLRSFAVVIFRRGAR
jgi:lipopolysaccharide/colanic/teichoic acid biosynthesis glycosyltransferase